ncbi:chemokine-like receptor 1 [Megalops cyprinoides]|uniref:chemokine-like receptor 1 n=1 Tax=Megalops cyprinoides TaxID=118141 RepID=UPI0018655EDB|nr:chemokine-like receptor 1 [Megalops cyprinoides]
MEEIMLIDYEDYNVGNDTTETASEVVAFQSHRSHMTDILLVVNSAICLLGVSGNGAVIWIAGFRMRRTVTTTWYLSLAVSDFLFCMCLPFSVVFMATSHWPFGSAMCKLTSCILFLNMFSSIFLLVLISVDRCASVTFPVWAQNHRKVRKASVVVILAWVASATLSMPSMFFREVKVHGNGTLCFTNYHTPSAHGAVALSRFVCGFAVPFLVIVSCYSIIIQKLRGHRVTRSPKPFRVASALIAAFFICWLPYHVFVLLEINHTQHSVQVMKVGLEMGFTLAAANSFLNPILYMFMGDNFRQKLRCSSMLWRIENAMGEDGNASTRCVSRSASMDGKATLYV